MNRIWLIAVLTVLLGGAMLTPPPPGTPSGDDTQVFLRQWQSFHITHYRFALVVICQCGLLHQPYTMEVRDGKLISALDSQGQPISDADLEGPPHSVDWFYGLTTIDSLFAHIEQVSSQGATVNVVYDPAYVFPAYIFVNWPRGRGGAEVALHVMDFAVLP